MARLKSTTHSPCPNPAQTTPKRATLYVGAVDNRPQERVASKCAVKGFVWDTRTVGSETFPAAQAQSSRQYGAGKKERGRQYLSPLCQTYSRQAMAPHSDSHSHLLESIRSPLPRLAPIQPRPDSRFAVLFSTPRQSMPKIKCDLITLWGCIGTISGAEYGQMYNTHNEKRRAEHALKKMHCPIWKAEHALGNLQRMDISKDAMSEKSYKQWLFDKANAEKAVEKARQDHRRAI